MDYSKLPVFGILSAKMDYLAQRQKLIAQNISGADMPNYVARDLEKFSFKSTLQQSMKADQPAVTNVRHFSGIKSNGGSEGYREQQRLKDVYEVLPSGNAVTIEQQMVNLSETSSDYQTATSLYRKMLGLFRTAVTGR